MKKKNVAKSKEEKLALMKSAMSMFHISSEILEKTGHAVFAKGEVQELKKVGTGATISSIVLHAFSCEVALKALRYKNGINIIRKHDLEELFRALPEDIKQRIEDKVMAADNGKGENENFNTLLANNKKAFEDWRYFYDKGELKVSIDFLKEFYKAIVGELLL